MYLFTLLSYTFKYSLSCGPRKLKEIYVGKGELKIQKKKLKEFAMMAPLYWSRIWAPVNCIDIPTVIISWPGLHNEPSFIMSFYDS